MRAVMFEAFGGPLGVVEVPDPRCRVDGVVVAVEATGLCRSDWHAWQGHDDGVTLPHVPGHELAGTVVEVGRDVGAFKVGDRVTTPFVLACGDCGPCTRGEGQVCAREEQPGFTRWGSWAERVALPRADLNLVRLPDGLGADAACLLGCRVATAYRAVAQVGAVRAGETVVVHGCGGVGLAAVMVGVGLGARVVAVDPAAASRELAGALGAEVHTPEDAAAVDDAEVSLDCRGSRATLAASLACLRPRGRHVQVGLLGGAEAHPPVDVGRVVARELQLLGSHGLPAPAYPELLARVTDGTVDPTRLVRTRVGLDEVADQLLALDRPGGGAGGVTVVRP